MESAPSFSFNIPRFVQIENEGTDNLIGTMLHAIVLLHDAAGGLLFYRRLNVSIVSEWRQV
jgi:hypothetical protein